jgi:hypothetical protein
MNNTNIPNTAPLAPIAPLLQDMTGDNLAPQAIGMADRTTLTASPALDAPSAPQAQGLPNRDTVSVPVAVTEIPGADLSNPQAENIQPPVLENNLTLVKNQVDPSTTVETAQIPVTYAAPVVAEVPIHAAPVAEMQVAPVDIKAGPTNEVIKKAHYIISEEPLNLSGLSKLNTDLENLTSDQL